MSAIEPAAVKRDYIIADIGLADWGRKELNIAETEMPISASALAPSAGKTAAAIVASTRTSWPSM